MSTDLWSFLSGPFTSRKPAQSINSYIWVSTKNPSVGSYQVWEDKTLTCYALTRSKGGLMTEMWLLLKCPERISWAAFLFSLRQPTPPVSARDCLSVLFLPGPPLPPPSRLLVLPTTFPGRLVSSSGPSVKQLWQGAGLSPPACESRVYNGVALHRGSLRSFMALAGMGEPIASTSSWYMTLI